MIHCKAHSILCFLSSLLLIYSCSEEESEPVVTNTTSNLVEVEYVLDFGNNDNASDLMVRYSVKDASNLSELRLFIAPVSNFASLNSTTLGALSNDRYQAIGIPTSSSDLSPSNSLLDTEGNQIRNNILYKLGFATINAGVISRDVVNTDFELRDQHYLTGRYEGRWKDEMFDVPFSMELTSVGNNLRGPVYATKFFQPKYGGNDDGSIFFQVAGNDLQDVMWNEFLDDFMGGCEGTWTGDGHIENLVNITLSLAGENCQYSSSNVEVDLSRVF